MLEILCVVAPNLPKKYCPVIVIIVSFCSHCSFSAATLLFAINTLLSHLCRCTWLAAVGQLATSYQLQTSHYRISPSRASFNFR